MKRKYLLIICLIAFLISLACVSASEDVNQTIDDTQKSDALSLDGTDEKLTVGNTWYVDSKSTYDEGTPDKPFANLKDALNKSSEGDTIMIASGTYAGDNNTNLKIDKNSLNLVRYGDDEAIFDGQNHTRIWEVNAKSISISGLTFKNGNGENGGAILFNSELSNSKINASFTNNYASKYGGAIYFNQTLTNVSITGNYANNTAGYGGANYFNKILDNVKINANFTSNTARDEYHIGSGGANLFMGALNNVEITGNYNRNTAYWDGGANYFNKTLDNVKINANFNGNTARHSGGANNFNGELNNVNMTGNYTFNQVNFTREPTYGGGANNFNKTLTNVKITGDYSHNKVIGENGYGDGGANNFRDTITDIEITGNYNNNTARYGGANNFFNPINNATIKGNYTNNQATDGGANHFYELNNVTINGNYTGNHASEGGANSFNSIANNVTVKGDYTGNHAYYLGGANFLYGATTNLNIIGNYNNNTAEYDGGANCFFDIVENTTITGNYTNNKAKGEGNFGYGGANYFLYSLTNVDIIGNYSSNTVTHYGGANYFKSSLNRVNIIGNYTNNRENANIYLYEKTYYHVHVSSYGGGANYFLDSLTDVNITGNYKSNQAIISATFDNCHHTIDPSKLENILTTDYNGGGANYFKNTLTHVNINGNYANNLAVINASYINNRVYKMENSYNGGGANYFYGGLSNVNITGTYANNKAKMSAKYSDNTNIELGNLYNGAGANHFMATLANVTLNANFTGNQVNGSDEDMIGGANSFAGMLNHVEIKGNYERNTAQTYGGANIFQKSLICVNITGNYANNIARDGGANYFHDTLNHMAMTGNYNNNIAFGQYSENGGGANYFHETLENVTITGNYTNNTAQKNGGANNFLNALTNVNITGNYNNNTANYGGANRFQSTLNQVAITGNYNSNTASLYGGANNFNRALTNVNITGNYTNNKADHSGGANYFRIAINNVTITGNYNNNTVQFSGGANHFLNALTNVEITGNYTNNKAQSNGGANNFQSTLTNVEINGNYNNNTAKNSGGANNFQKTLNQITITGNYNNNTAMNGWGGANNFQETLNQITITGNYANNTANLHGSANYFNKALTNVNITGNYNNNTGKEAIYIYNTRSEILIHDSIFINEKITIVHGNIKARDTWFGNNATNYNETPKVGKEIDLENWLFLNATADPISLAILDTSKIQFKLYSYNSTGTFDYDNSKLSSVNLTITATNGNVNPTAKLGENITYTATGIGTRSVTGSIENVFYTIELNNVKADSKLSVDPQEVYYGNNTIITLSYNSIATGKVNITLKGKKSNYTFKDMDLNTTISLGKIQAGEYNVTVTYSGDDNFKRATANATLTVKPIVCLSVNMTSDKEEYIVGDIAVWTITVHNAANGTDATDVTLYDYFPGDNFDVINVTTKNGTCTEQTKNSYYLWEIGVMANGTDVVLVITSRAMQPRNDILNYAAVFSNEDEWDYNNTVARKTVDVIGLPQISKTVSNDNPYYNDEILYNLTIINNGSATYKYDLTLVDILPQGLEFIGVENVAGADVISFNNETLTWVLTNVTNDTPAVITVRVKATETGSITNDLTITDYNGNSRTVNCTIDVKPIVDVSADIKSNKDACFIGDIIVWTITVHNAANATTATNVTLAGLLSTKFTYINSTTDKGTYNNTEGIWEIGTMDNGTDAHLKITAYANTAYNKILNEVVVNSNEDDWNWTNNWGYNYITIIDLPDINKTTPSDKPYYNDEILYKLTITNNAAINYTNTLNIVDSLPAGLEFIKTENITGADIINPEEVNDQTITWHLTNITNKTPAVITIRTKVKNTGNITNNMTISTAYGQNKTTNCTIDAKPIVDVSTNIKSNKDTCFIGDIIIWTITVHNAANATTATNVTLAGLLSTKFTYINSTTDKGTYNNTEGIWEIGTMKNGTDAHLKITAYANTAYSKTLNEVVVNSNEDDWNWTNNWGYNYITIIDLPDINKTTPSDKPYYNDEILYKLTITNKATINYTNTLKVTDSLPAGLEFIKTENITGANIVNSEETNCQTITWHITNITNKAPAVITIRTKVKNTGNITNNMTISTAYGHNKNANCTVESKAIVDIAADITADKDTYLLGDEAIWIVTVRNAGNGTDATGVTVDEFFPFQYFKYTGYETNNGTYDNESGVWNVGFMANGTEATLHIYGRAIASKTHITNRAVAACNEEDWNISNNLAYSYVDVEKIKSTVNVTDTSLDYGKAANITVETEGATGITAKIDDVNATVKGNTVMIPVLDVGNYTLTVTTVPDENHTSANATARITINKVDSTLSIDRFVFDYGIAANVTATTQGATGITAKISDENLTVNGDTIEIPDNLGAGPHVLSITTIPDENHNSITKNITIHINKASTTLTANSITATYNNDKNLVISLKDGQGNAIGGATITVDFNGAKKYATDENGKVKISTKGRVPKTYNIKISFAGDDNYNKSSATAKVVIKKATPKITAKAKTYKTTAKSKKYTITLKNNKGKAMKNVKVTLKVNGKTYTAKTNSKGKATFNLKKLTKKGKYTATITYKGSKYYKKATKKVKITVKSGFKTVCKGSKDHKTVKKIQRALKKNGYYITYKGHYLMVDGIFHDCTERSVKQFQKAKGLKVTGKVDEKTAKKLKII